MRITYEGKPSPVIPRTPQQSLWLRYGVLTERWGFHKNICLLYINKYAA
jgi:hypothetical protein